MVPVLKILAVFFRPIPAVVVFALMLLAPGHVRAAAAPADDQCAAPKPGGSAAVGQTYVPPRPGTKLSVGSYDINVLGAADGMVFVVNSDGLRTALVRGVVQFGRKSDPDALASLWPLRVGASARLVDDSIGERVHQIAVVSTELVPIAGYAPGLRIFWLSDRITSTGLGVSDVNDEVTIAYAPQLGLPIAEVARHLAPSRFGAQSWFTTKFNFCGSEYQSDWALKAVEELAAGGNPEAQDMLGLSYFSGLGIEQDANKALALLKQAADQGYGPSLSTLANLYVSDGAIPHDYKRAFEFAEAAAKSGAGEGFAALGSLYYAGWGVDQNQAKARDAYRDGADRADATSALALAGMMRDGDGGPQNRIASYAWFAVAARVSGVSDDISAATRGIDDLREVMLPDEVVRARKLVARWKPGAGVQSDFSPGAEGGSEPAAPGNKVADGPASELDFAIDVKQRLAKRAEFDRKAIEDRPFVQNLLTVQIELNDDGTRTDDVHVEIQAKSDAGARQIGEQSVYFDEATETVDFVDAYTRKANGGRQSVDTSHAVVQAMPAAGAVAEFTDMRRKVLEYPNVESGDTIVYSAKYHRKPIIPNYFALYLAFDPHAALLQAQIDVITSRSRPLLTETRSLVFERQEDGNKYDYHWEFDNLSPDPEQHKWLVDPSGRVPRMIASSVTDYDALARAFAKLTAGKTVVTPAIKSKADEVTAGITDRQGQARAIHDWVAKHIRYVAIELGKTRLVPHPAENVLKNGYGDCKDHSVLMSALLKAKGIDSELVLINATNGFALPVPPMLEAFNHMITWLPEFGVYSDTTSIFAPLGILPFNEAGTPVVHINSSGATVRRTPLPDPATTTLKAEMSGKITPTGMIEVDTTSVATGAYSVLNRALAFRLTQNGADDGVKAYLKARSFEGTGRFNPMTPFDLSPTFTTGAHFEIGPINGIPKGDNFFPPAMLPLGVPPGTLLAGDIRAKEVDQPSRCFNGTETQQISLELPSGWHLKQLPDNRSVMSPHLTFTSNWTQEARSIIVKRSFKTNFSEAVCIGAIRDEAVQAYPEIIADYDASLALVED